MANVWPCIDCLSVLPLRLSPLTSMITVSSCGVKLQELGPLRLGKKAKALDIHMHFCGFSQHSFIHSFITLLFFSTWGVKCDLILIVVYAGVRVGRMVLT